MLGMTWPAKGKKYICGFDGTPPLFTNLHAIMCPDVDPFTQNALSNVPECTFFPVQSPAPVADPKSTVLLVVGTPVVKLGRKLGDCPADALDITASRKGEHLVGCGVGGIGNRNRRIRNPRSCVSASCLSGHLRPRVLV